MRATTLLLAALALAAPGAAGAADATPTPTPTPTATATIASGDVGDPDARPVRLRPRRELPLAGLALDAGFPSLATASLMLRPLSHLRVFGGPCWSPVGWGVQGGAVLALGNWAVTPTLSFEAGNLFRTDASRYLKGGGGDAENLKPLLRRLDYSYWGVNLGLEVGSPRGFAWFLRLGLASLNVRANGTATTTKDGRTIALTDPALHATVPALRSGLQYWF